MSERSPSSDHVPANRRDFLKSSTAAVAGATLAGTLAVGRSAHAAGSDVLKIGLVGCGGRGTGAAKDALSADSNSKLVAMADTFTDRLESSLRDVRGDYGDRVEVSDDRKFVGFDAYQKLLASDVDVVLLTTPPHFRPAHLKAAVAAGKHIFCEKPVAVDAPGVRSVMETVVEARKKNLALVSGLCYRYEHPKRDVIGRIHEGAIGQVRAIQSNYLTGYLWQNPRQPAWSDMEFQLRNWLYFTWLSGDFNVEQHVHSLDKASWVLNDRTPLQATGLGGRQVRTQPEFGNVFDHMAVVYEYADGVRVFSNCRQQAGCTMDTSDHVMGTKGLAELMSATISGETNYKYSGPTRPGMYQFEHKELFASIRSGNPINNGNYMTSSTMMAIMGRMVCYTGKTLTWEQCLNSQEDFTRPKYEWGPLPTPAVARPGITAFV